MATTIPPRAVPSSLVSASPVTPTTSLNCRAWANAFWPTVASNTSRISCGAPGSAARIFTGAQIPAGASVPLEWQPWLQSVGLGEAIGYLGEAMFREAEDRAASGQPTALRNLALLELPRTVPATAP